jgi:hypothetical protein
VDPGERIHEVPLPEWREIGSTKLKLRDFLRAPLDLLRISRRYPLGRRAAGS